MVQNKHTRIRDLPGLGTATEAILSEIGINDAQTLIDLGPLEAFYRLYQHQGRAPNRNFLYALVGAVENRSWLNVAQEDKFRLMLEVDQMHEEFSRQQSEEES